MKRLLPIILTTTLSLTAYGAQEQSNNIGEAVTKSIDILVGAYNGAENAVAKHDNRHAHPIKQADVEQLKNQTINTLNTLQNIGEQLQNGNIENVATNIEQLQQQYDSKGEIPNIANLIRKGDRLYRNLKGQYTAEDFKHLTPNQMIAVLNQSVSALRSEPSTQEIGDALAGISHFLITFSQLVDTPDRFDTESQAFHQDVQHYKNLAYQQGIPNESDPVDSLITALKLATAEHHIGQPSANRDRALKAQLSKHLNNPRTIFSRNEYQAVSKLLKQLGADFATEASTWTQLENQLVR